MRDIYSGKCGKICKPASVADLEVSKWLVYINYPLHKIICTAFTAIAINDPSAANGHHIVWSDHPGEFFRFALLVLAKMCGIFQWDQIIFVQCTDCMNLVCDRRGYGGGEN